MNEKNKCWLRRNKELLDRNSNLFNLIDTHFTKGKPVTSLATKTKRKVSPSI